MRARNQPKPGEVITVEPIKSVKDIATIKRLLAGKPRDYALFVVGINTALRASDLLKLTAGQVRVILADEDGGLVRETKTGKRRRLIFNKAAREALSRLLATRDFDSAEPVFLGQRGQLSASYLCRLVKSWCETINLKGQFGSHSLRKTWGYHQRVTFGVDIPTLMDALGHSTQRQTLAYLCIQPDEIKSVYANEL